MTPSRGTVSDHYHSTAFLRKARSRTRKTSSETLTPANPEASAVPYD